MEKKNVKCDISLGAEVGKEVEKKLIKAQRRIIIITPWISKRYMEIIQQKSRIIKDVLLITSLSHENKKAFSSFLKVKWKNIFISISIYVVLILIAREYAIIFLPLLAYALLRSFVLTPNFTLIIQADNDKHFLHLKAYLIDDTLYLGSFNLTESGVRWNIESIIKTRDKKAVESFIEYANKIKREVKKVSWRKVLYKMLIKV